MVLEIIWSPEAIATFSSTLSYLRTEWSEKEVTQFKARVNQKLALLTLQPRIGKPSKKGSLIFRTVLHKRITLVYHYQPLQKQIELITFWNNWQDPKRSKHL